MVDYWDLNGTLLKGADGSGITVIPIQGSTDLRKRVPRRDIAHSTQIAQSTGLDLAERTLRFAIRRSGDSDHYATLQTILDILKDNDVVYLVSPDGLPSQSVRAFESATTVWLIPERIGVPDPKGHGVITLDVTFLTLGVPIAYNGEIYQDVQGSFEYQAATATRWLREDGETFSDVEGPLITLPEQTAGYPLFRAVSSLAFTTPTLISTENVSDSRGTRTYATYDLTGYLHPEPTADGEVGLYEGRSSPTAEWFEYTLALVGIAVLQIGSFAVGMG